MENYPHSTTTTSTTTTHHPSPPRTPVTISDPNNPYPTTFIQADTTSFKKVVQMLTGSSQPTTTTTAACRPEPPTKNPIPPIKTGHNKKPSKLYERRNTQKNFKLSPLVSGLITNGPRNPNMPEILSPSILDFTSLMLSPVTPLTGDAFIKSPVNDGGVDLDVEAEEKAIAEKGFYLHPSPASTPGKESEPRLLALFPVTSLRFSGASSS